MISDCILATTGGWGKALVDKWCLFQAESRAKKFGKPPTHVHTHTHTHTHTNTHTHKHANTHTRKHAHTDKCALVSKLRTGAERGRGQMIVHFSKILI